MQTFIITMALIANLLVGTISDSQTQERLAGVRINSNHQTIYTDLDGNFTMAVDSLDTLSLNLISYSDTIFVVDDVYMSKNQNINLEK